MGGDVAMEELRGWDAQNVCLGGEEVVGDSDGVGSGLGTSIGELEC